MRLFERREREQQDEQLSAYLDGELSAEERTRLEAQLAADPALQAELDVLRHTVALVRDLPRVPIPRNFILPRTAAARPQPAPSARPQRAWLAPLLTAATAVVSLVFVVVLADGLWLPTASRQAAAPMADQTMELEAPQEVPMPMLAEEVEVEVEVVVTNEVQAEDTMAAEEAAEAEAEEAAGLAAVATDTPLAVSTEALAPDAARMIISETQVYAEAPPPGMDMGTPGMGGGGPTGEPTLPYLAATAPPSPAAVGEAEEAATTQTIPEANGDEGFVGDEAAFKAAGEEESPTIEPQWDVPEGEAGMRATELRLQLSPRLVLTIILGISALGLALAAIWAWRARR